MARATRQSGFSLIEAILYLALFVSLSVFLIDALLVMSRAYTEVRVNRDLLESAQLSMDRMTREIRAASRVSSPDGSAITVNTKDEHGQPAIAHFSIVDDAIVYGTEEAGAAAGKLTGSHVKVDSLSFHTIRTQSGQAVRIEMALHSLRSPSGKSISLTDTVVLRGSYSR